jgi:hypothetical protein
MIPGIPAATNPMSFINCYQAKEILSRIEKSVSISSQFQPSGFVLFPLQ